MKVLRARLMSAITERHDTESATARPNRCGDRGGIHTYNFPQIA